MTSNTFFTADTHFGHRFMADMRGFVGIDEMDEALIEKWNAKVPNGATVYHLGDVTFRNSVETLGILARLNGNICLVKGNHDNGVTKGARAAFFTWIKDYYKLKVGQQKVIMCHFPFRSWDSMHYGAWNLHGHSHGNLPQKGLQMDVGVDCWDLAPVSWEEVKEYMKDKKLSPVDHHQLKDN